MYLFQLQILSVLFNTSATQHKILHEIITVNKQPFPEMTVKANCGGGITASDVLNNYIRNVNCFINSPVGWLAAQEEIQALAFKLHGYLATKWFTLVMHISHVPSLLS